MKAQLAVEKHLKFADLETIFQDFNEATGIAIALTEHQTQDVVIKAGWRTLCSRFFRPHPVAGPICQKSKNRLVSQLSSVGQSVYSHCDNGVVMGCTSIVVDQEHIADLFIGQLFFEPPDLEWFQSQAQVFQFDETDFLESLKDLPVYPRDKFLPMLRCIAHTVQLVINLTLDLEEQASKKHTAELERTNKILERELGVQVKLRSALTESQAVLNEERANLEESNTALRVLIKQIDAEKKAFEEQVSLNLMSFVEPHLEKLKRTTLDEQQKSHLDIIDAHLKTISSPFVRSSVAIGFKLSPNELQIANLIRQGKTSKQIAELLSLSRLTVDKHRNNIRKKIGITNRKINLKTFLNSKMEIFEARDQDFSVPR